jgi:hypothetical protein
MCEWHITGRGTEEDGGVGKKNVDKTFLRGFAIKF